MTDGRKLLMGLKIKYWPLFKNDGVTTDSGDQQPDTSGALEEAKFK